MASVLELLAAALLIVGSYLLAGIPLALVAAGAFLLYVARA